MTKIKVPAGSIWVVETECCGLKIHGPNDLGQPCHGRRAEDHHLPRNVSYPACKIIRYWRYRNPAPFSVAEAKVSQKYEDES